MKCAIRQYFLIPLKCLVTAGFSQNVGQSSSRCQEGLSQGVKGELIQSLCPEGPENEEGQPGTPSPAFNLQGDLTDIGENVQASVDL